MAMATASSGSLVDRAIRAAKLDVNAYEEVEADTNATSQALTIVVVTAVASGIGLAISAAMAGKPGSLVGGLIGGILGELIGWAVWAWVMYFVGTRMFNGQATWGEVLRTTGFAYAPGVLLVLRFLPVLGGLIALVVGIWRLVTGFVAIRQALDISNGQTVGTIIIGIIGYIVVAVVVGLILAAIGLGGAALLGAPM